MTAEGKQQKKKKESLISKGENSGDADNDSTSIQRKKSGNKKRKSRPIKETESASDIETSGSFKPSTEFSVSPARKGRVIGKRLPSARPGAGNFVPNKQILDEPFFPGSPESVTGKRRSHSRSLSPKGKAKSLQTLNAQIGKGAESTAQTRKGRGRIRSTSPSRKVSNVSQASEGDGSASLSTARKKKKASSRSKSASPVRKASNISTSSDGALSAYLKRESLRGQSSSPTRKSSNVSTWSQGSASSELWTLPRRKSSVQSQSLSPTARGRRSLELDKVIEEKESSGVRKSASPVRKASNVSNSSDGALSAYLKKRERLRSQSSSPTRKNSNVSTRSQGSATPSQGSASSELWTLPRRKSSGQSQSLSPPARRRRSLELEKVIEENESAGVSTILKKKIKAMARSQSSSPVRKPKNVSQAVKIGELSPLSAVLKKKTNEIKTRQSLSPIREARTVSKALKGEQSSSIASILKKKKNQMTRNGSADQAKKQLRSRSSSPVRKGRASTRDDDASSTSSASTTAKKPKKTKSRSLSPVREKIDPPQSPGSLALRLRMKKEQITQSLSFAVKQNTEGSIENDAHGSAEVSKKTDATKRSSLSPNKSVRRGRSSSPVRKGRASIRDDDESSAPNKAKKQGRKPKSRSLSPVRENSGAPQSPGSLSLKLRKKKEQIKRSLSFTAKRSTESSIENDAEVSKKKDTKKSRSLSPKAVDGSSANKKRNQGIGSRRSAIEHQSSARIDFTGTVIHMDENPSVHSQLTTPGSTHNDTDKPKNRRQSLQTIRSHEDEDDEHPASTLSFAMEPPDSVLSFGGKPPESAEFSLIDTSELGSALEEHIGKSRSRDTENSTPSIEDDNSHAARPSTRHLNPDADNKKSVRPVAPGGNVAFKDGRSTDFPEDTAYQKVLRYLYILPPVHNETQRERRTRALTWASLICDFLAAVVSVTTFSTVNTCCGIPILSTIARTDWDLIIRIFVYVYISMIFMEVVPVIRHQLPFNLINPTLGFLVTFAVFFDDDIAEAVIMWVIEVIAIICEFEVYRLKRKTYQDKEAFITNTEEEIKQIKERMRGRRREMKKLREASPGKFQGRVKRVDMENGSYPEPPILRSYASTGTRSADSSRSPIRKVSNSPKRKASGSPMRVGSRSISLGSRSRSPSRTFSNSPKRTSSRSPLRERLERDLAGSLSPVRDSFHPRKRTSLSPLRRESSSSVIHENNSDISSLSPSRGISHRSQRKPSFRRGSSGAFSTGNRSTGSSPGPSARSGARVGRSPVRRPLSPSSDAMHVPMGSEGFFEPSYLTYEEEEWQAHRQEHRLDDQQEMQKLVQVRRWKKEQEVDLQYLGYLMAGVVYNLLLVMVTMIFMSMIAKNQGLCIVDMTAPAIFESGQLERCSNSKCLGNEQCEFCAGDPQFGEGDVEKCFYPWY